MVAPGHGHVVDDPRVHVALLDPVTQEIQLLLLFILGQVVLDVTEFSDGFVLVELNLNARKRKREEQ